MTGMAPSTVKTSASTWIMLLAGPTIWYAYFWVVYLLAESVCGRGGLDFAIGGMAGLSIVTIAITLAASILIVIAALRTYSVWKEHKDGGGRAGLAFAGLVLNAVSFLAVLLTGLPALGLKPC